MKKLRIFFLVIIISMLPFIGGCAAPIIGLVQAGLTTGGTSLVTDVVTDTVRDNGGYSGVARKAGNAIGDFWDSLTGKKEEIRPSSPKKQRKMPVIRDDKKKVRVVEGDG